MITWLYNVLVLVHLCLAQGQLSNILSIVIDGETNVTLPTSDVVLIGHVAGNKSTDDDIEWAWTTIEAPSDTRANEIVNNNQLVIPGDELTSGIYKFSLTGALKSSLETTGSAFFNLQVMSEKLPDKVPLEVSIGPKVIQLPQTHILLVPQINDAYKVEDLNFDWEPKKVPLKTAELLRTNKINLNDATLELDVAPEVANMTFSLTVTERENDDNGQSSSAVAIVRVEEEPDQAPTAKITPQESKITLPTSSTKLCGNSSLDDHEVTEYLWEANAEDNPEAVDLSGSHEVCLSLKSIRKPGTYHFTLTVSDKKGQTDTAVASIIVEPSKNTKPVARLDVKNVMHYADGTPVYFVSSSNPLILDGSSSSDPDGDQLRYYFSNLSGGVEIAQDPKAKQSTIEVNDITTAGVYKFQLRVTDDGEPNLSSSATISVNVTTGANPTVIVDDEKTIVGPASIFSIDASSSSSFDGSTLEYNWTAFPSILAGFSVYNNSNFSPILQILNADIGEYKFNLTVTDKIGQSTSKISTVQVIEDPEIPFSLEITVKNCPSMTKRQSIDAEQELLLDLTPAETIQKISILKVFHPFHSPDLVLLIRAYDRFGNGSAPELVIPHLEKTLVSSGGFKSFCHGKIVTVSPLVCLSLCSGHGSCSNMTKTCECDSFWIPNPMITEPNCAWSLLYLVMSIVICLTSAIVAIIILAKKRKYKIGKAKKLSKRRSDYAALHAESDSDDVEITRRTRKKRPLRPKNTKPDRSPLINVEDSSDPEPLFDKSRISEDIL